MRNIDTDKRQNWDGGKNRSIRLYFYCQRGLALINEFRYVIMTIFGLYMLLKLDNPLIMVVMFLIIVPVLIVLGWFQVHHMAKVMNWLDVEFASFWSRYGFELQERQVKALEEINSKIENK